MSRSHEENQPLRKRRLDPPPPSSSNISAVMRGNRSKDTEPELLLRSVLWKYGIRGYRKHRNDIPGRPDLVFIQHQLAVLVHGCFWHGCPKCNIRMPRTNAQYWTEKLSRNRERDRKNFLRLKRSDWQIIRIWECDVRRSAKRCANRIARKLKS